MTVHYKLTTKDMRTGTIFANEIKWEIGKWNTSTGNPEQPLGSNGFIHWFFDPEEAVLLRPVLAQCDYTRLWEVETDGYEKTEYNIYGGSQKVRLAQEIEPTNFTSTQLAIISVLTVQQIGRDPDWLRWSRKWLSQFPFLKDYVSPWKPMARKKSMPNNMSDREITTYWATKNIIVPNIGKLRWKEHELATYIADILFLVVRTASRYYDTPLRIGQIARFVYLNCNE